MARFVYLSPFPYISLILLIDLFYENRYSHTRMVNPDFILLAQAMNVHAIRCHSAEELPAKMKEFLEYDGSRPVLMECLVDKNEHVFPMVCLSVPSPFFLS
jgi:acetolactate synthase-1/2/3 large subunit